GDDPRVPPLLRDVRLRCPGHGLVDEIVDAPDGLDIGDAQGTGDALLHPAPCRLPVEGHLTPEEVVLVEIAEEQVRIGHAGIGPSPAVAEWSRVGPRALRSYLEGAHL